MSAPRATQTRSPPPTTVRLALLVKRIELSKCYAVKYTGLLGAPSLYLFHASETSLYFQNTSNHFSRLHPHSQKHVSSLSPS